MNSSSKIQIGISACLLGFPVRYDGADNRSELCLELLNAYFEFMPFCPEATAGFGTPRPPMHLTGNPSSPSLCYREGGDLDLTEKLIHGFEDKMDEFSQLDGFILVKNSPSCGVNQVKIFHDNGEQQEKFSQGLFAAALQKHFPTLPIEEETSLHDPTAREQFIARVYAYFKERNDKQSSLQ